MQKIVESFAFAQQTTPFNLCVKHGVAAVGERDKNCI